MACFEMMVHASRAMLDPDSRMQAEKNLRWIYRIRAPPVTIPTFQICTRAGLPQGLAFNSLTCKDGVNMI